jgi:hypothetical protein
MRRKKNYLKAKHPSLIQKGETYTVPSIIGILQYFSYFGSILQKFGFETMTG